jgi:hypothetical protein
MAIKRISDGHFGGFVWLCPHHLGIS